MHLPGVRAPRGSASSAWRPAAELLRAPGAQRLDRTPGTPASRAPRARVAWRTRPPGGSVMANEAYRAVFLRVHPTGKMVLSLTTESDGKEGQYAQQVADELGVPALDVKVLAADENRF